MKLSSVSMILLILGTQATLPATARADDPAPPTYVRERKFEIVPCVAKMGLPDVLDNRRKCSEMMDASMAPGTSDVFLFDRPSLDRMLTVSQSEERCRKEIVDCRTGAAASSGWSPVAVVLVAGGVVVVVGGVAFLAGYLVGR